MKTARTIGCVLRCRLLWGIILGLASRSLLQADVHPERLQSFRLERSPLLRGFVPGSFGSHPHGMGMDADSGAAAVLHFRAFKGASELRYHVFLFDSQKALYHWDRLMRASSPGWVSPLHRPADAEGLRKGRLGGGEFSRAIIVNRVVLLVAGYQHQESIRRNPKLASRSLSDKQLIARAEKVCKELVKRARALPANQDRRRTPAGGRPSFPSG